MSREAFEEDAKPYGYSLAIAKCGCCDYLDGETQRRWEGWQAATEQSAKELQELRALVARTRTERKMK